MTIDTCRLNIHKGLTKMERKKIFLRYTEQSYAYFNVNAHYTKEKAYINLIDIKVWLQFECFLHLIF